MSVTPPTQAQTRNSRGVASTEKMRLTDRNVDEIDAILIPAAAALRDLADYCADLGITPGQMLLIVRERLPVARLILAETSPNLH